MRKHHTQMNDNEKKAVRAMVKAGGTFKINPYTKQRMAQRNISELDLAKTLWMGEVIEVHNNITNEIRALFRLDINGKACCVVVCLNMPKVVTCYWNNSKDNHITLDVSKYKWNTNILPILQKAEREGNLRK